MFALLLALAACDTNEILSTAKLSTNAFDVDAPEVLRFGEVAIITATLTNTTNANLYVGRPALVLFRESDPIYSTGAQSPATLTIAYSPYVTSILVENELIGPGESRVLGIALDLRHDGLALWGEVGPVDGTYRLGATLFTTPGDLNSLYRGAPAPTDVSFSVPFTLAFSAE